MINEVVRYWYTKLLREGNFCFSIYSKLSKNRLGIKRKYIFKIVQNEDTIHGIVMEKGIIIEDTTYHSFEELIYNQYSELENLIVEDVVSKFEAKLLIDRRIKHIPTYKISDMTKTIADNSYMSIIDAYSSFKNKIIDKINDNGILQYFNDDGEDIVKGR